MRKKKERPVEGEHEATQRSKPKMIRLGMKLKKTSEGNVCLGKRTRDFLPFRIREDV